MSRQVLLGLLIVVGLGSAAGWFLANFEQVPEKVWVGFQGKARRDWYLAGQRLLERMGLQVTPVREVPALRTLPPQGMLFLPAGRQAITPQLRESILSWVQQGGRLMVEPEPVHQPDPLLDELGVKRTAIDVEEEPTEDEDSPSPPDTIDVALPEDLPAMKLRMYEHISVDSEHAVRSFGGQYATTLLLMERGRGDVIVVNDFGLLDNYRIGEHDHAEFLWRVTQLRPAVREAAFFNNPQQLSLLDWLLLNAWPVLAAGAALLLLWLWRVAPRFGPVLPDPERQRRRLLDHLRASGRFLWSNGGRARLIEAAREACLRHVIRAHPDLLAAPESERAERIAQLLAMPVDLARQVVSAPTQSRAADFMQTISLYQEIHERLALRRTSRGTPTRRTG